jgi:DNA-directed RNA polymerase specialized sigma24 family protein
VDPDDGAAYDRSRKVAQSEVAMAERFAEPPSFDEYVVARGADLLRTAWLLVGDDRGAEELVRTTLARSWPQWRHLSHVGAGSYDAELRRALVATYLRRRRSRPHPSQPSAPSDRSARADLLAALAELGPRERVALVLWTFDGLSDGQVAAALDDDETTARRHRLHALATLQGRLGLDEERLRTALAELPPQDPPVAGLLEQTRPYAARWRGARGWALGGAALVVAVAAGGILASGDGDRVVLPTPTPEPSRISCRDSARAPTPPPVSKEPLSRSVAAVLVCAQTDEGSVWSGFLPPDAPDSVPLAVDALVLAPRTKGSECADLPRGPAFRLVMLGTDGEVHSYANEGLACNGWPALASYYTALAEQGVAADPRVAATDDGFLGCPTVLGKSLAPPGVAPPSLPRGTVLEAATACLHPRAVATSVPRFRPIRANVLGVNQLAQLNADLARSGSRTQAGSRCTAGTSLFVVEARTVEGRLLELSSNCADVFAVDWQSRDNWTVSAQTRDMLRALLVAQ